MSLESRDQIANTLITGAARAGAGRSRGLSDLETLEALRQAQRQQYLERNARNANEEATLAALSEVDKGYRIQPLIETMNQPIWCKKTLQR